MRFYVLSYQVTFNSFQTNKTNYSNFDVPNICTVKPKHFNFTALQMNESALCNISVHIADSKSDLFSGRVGLRHHCSSLVSSLAGGPRPERGGLPFLGRVVQVSRCLVDE